jgi:hypothetical protein
MQAVANNPKFAKKVGVPVTVGQEFTKSGGGMASKMNPGMMAMMKKKAPAKKMAKGGYADGGMPMVMKDGQKVPAFAADGKGKMAKGGMAHKDVKMDKGMMQKAVNKHEGRLHKGAEMTKLSKGGMAPSKMGSVKSSSSRDGVASKGKTKGTMIKMNKGGKAC